MTISTPAGISWDPRNSLSPGTPRTGLNGLTLAWEFLTIVFTDIIPASWAQITRLF